ncbi:MAG: hypothetical protein HN764_06595 [Gammaproteobacteria bacterium]|jgi:hypothetical protein|nr:hypothetical protein [Gammaproteobacteria bacterium]
MTKVSLPGLIIFILLFPGSAYPYSGNSWNAVYDAVFDEPYTSLPQFKVDDSFFGPANDDEENALKYAAKRTLSIKDDLYEFPQGRKLLQANGICFAGHWIINRESDYTGVLSKGSHYPLIARASVSLSGTKYTDKRAFGMAIKIFPAQSQSEIVQTLNVFVMETMAGKRRQYFLQAIMDNAPTIGGLPGFGDWSLALRLQKDLKAADKELSPLGPNIAYRSIRHLAKINDAVDNNVVSPKWLRLRVTADTPLSLEDDFRNELSLESFPNQELIWEIEVADDHKKGKSNANWKRLGKILIEESVVSKACDDRLHFAHPLLDDN